MSKSYDNYIALDDSPEDMYGKIMSINDSMILKYYKLAIFAERESHAAFFLQEQEMTRYDAVNFIAHGVAKNPNFAEDRKISGSNEELEEISEDNKTEKESALKKYCKNLPNKLKLVEEVQYLGHT